MTFKSVLLPFLVVQVCGGGKLRGVDIEKDTILFEPEGSQKRGLVQELAPEICGYTNKWDWEGDGYKHPVVPCTAHDDCRDFTDTGGWQPCCMVHDCLCGSVQSLFTPGVQHCGRFVCTEDDHCWPGVCDGGQCSFENIEPCCWKHEDCPEDEKCYNGVCHEVDSSGFIRINNKKSCSQSDTQKGRKGSDD